MFDKSAHVVTTAPEPARCDYYVSCDYGTVNPTSIGLWALDRYTGVATRLREYYWDSRARGARRTDEEHYTALLDMVGNLADRIQYIIVDPSAASFIECIRRHQQFTVRAAENRVLDGIRDTATLLQLGCLRIHQSCEDTCGSLRCTAGTIRRAETRSSKPMTTQWMICVILSGRQCGRR